jgi:CRP-like cAMP-binding protein
MLVETSSEHSAHALKGNLLIDRIREDEVAALAGSLQPCTLQSGQMLERSGRPIEYAHFLTGGFACTPASTERHRGADVGMIGAEGLVGWSTLLGIGVSAHDVQMQVAGAALRIRPHLLAELTEYRASVRHLLLQYVYDFTQQVMRTALVNARETLDARLARWLLMAHDRVQGDRICVTHEAIAAMLGVRRAGVSTAVKRLEQQGYVALHRGAIVVTDRKQLETSSDGAYAPQDRTRVERVIN